MDIYIYVLVYIYSSIAYSVKHVPVPSIIFTVVCLCFEILRQDSLSHLSETRGAEELAAVPTLGESFEQAAVSARRSREKLQEVLGSPPAYFSGHLNIVSDRYYNSLVL